MNQNKPIFLTYDILRNIGDISGIVGINKLATEQWNDEGWRIVKIADTTFGYRVEFKSAADKVMFVLKYGNGK